MIVSRTPYRVSLFGGGSDLPGYFQEHGGEVLGFTINKFCRIGLRPLPPFFTHKHRLVWSQIELVNSWDDVKHPAIREVMKLYGPDCGIELHHDGDLPAQSGLGSSSAFVVGLLNALLAFRGDQTVKRLLAKEAIYIEQKVLNEAVGSQDQIWAAYGGFNRIEFFADGNFEVTPVILPNGRKAELKESLLLVFTGHSRMAHTIESKKIANLPQKQRFVHQMRAMVSEAMAIMQNLNRPLSDIGSLLHESWRLKKELAPEVTTPHVDTIYEAARSAGALGGKLLGAGGGGFMLLYCRPDQKALVRERLADLISVSFEIGSEGSRIVLYEPDGL